MRIRQYEVTPLSATIPRIRRNTESAPLTKIRTMRPAENTVKATATHRTSVMRASSILLRTAYQTR